MSEYDLVNVLDRAGVGDYTALFEMSYGQSSKFSERYLHWLYEENPHGRAVGFDAYLDGELAAHYVTIPRLYRVGGEDILGLLSVNTATHPNHQRRGLFTRLAVATYEHAAAHGYKYVLGVANAQSIHGFLHKLEFERLGQIGLALWQKPVASDPNYAHLCASEDWIRWRLANPAAEYFLTSVGDDEAIVNTCKGRLVFSLGRAKRSNLPDGISSSNWRGCRGLAPLTPVYPKERNGLFVPKRLMPSPWHVIFRRLELGLDYMKQVHLDGLSMDTF